MILRCIESMRLFPDDVYICENGCAVLGNVATDSERNRLAVIEAGGEEVMQESLRRHPNARRLVIFANRGLSLLSQQHEAFIAMSIQSIESTLLRLQQHHDNDSEESATLHRNGLEDLSAYAQVYSQHRNLILSRGGLRHVLVVMNRFRDDAKIQRLGCTMLENLASDSNLNLQAYIRTVGGITEVIEPVLNAMCRFVDDGIIQQKACVVFFKLVKAHDSNRYDLVSAGVARAIEEAMRRHPGNSGVKIFGRMGLSLLMSTTPER